MTVTNNKLKTVNKAIDEVRKLFGEETVYRSTDTYTLDVEALRTGSTALDDALGIGGIPKGRIIQIAGAESSGKTLLALTMAAQVHKQGGLTLFIDGEHTYDPEWAKALGCNEDLMLITQPDDAQQAFRLIAGSKGAKDKSGKRKHIPGLLENESILEAGLQLVIIDSVASLAPPQEADADVGQHLMAVMARFLPPTLRKVIPLLSKTGVALVLINQVRVNPAQMFGNPEGTPGGRALKHDCSIMIHVAGINAKEAKIFDENGDQIGHRIKFKIEKNKVATPFKSGEFDIEYLRGIVNDEEGVLDVAVKKGFIKRPTSQKYELNLPTYDVLKWTGRATILEALQEGEALLAALKDAIYNGVKEPEGKTGIKESAKKDTKKDNEPNEPELIGTGDALEDQNSDGGALLVSKSKEVIDVDKEEKGIEDDLMEM